MSDCKIVKVVLLSKEDVGSSRQIEIALDRAEGVIHYSMAEWIIFVVPMPEIIKDWLLTRHYRLVRSRYCAMASSLGVPVISLMDIFRRLNGAIEWAGGCGSVSDDEKQKCFLRFGERLSAELFAAALARRRGGELVKVIDGVDFFGSHFGVSFEKSF